jgi:16S rRNA (uracil1498-N3)-methyltransferase
VVFAVGPEGGFTDEEVATARDLGWRAVNLGPRILRVETAALVLAACAASS